MRGRVGALFVTARQARAYQTGGVLKYLGGLGLSALTVAVLQAPGRAVTLTPAQKCEAAKLLSAATYGKCRLKADRKSVVTGAPVDYTNCDANFLRAYTRIETNAAGACPTTGDAAAVQTRISGDTAALTAEIGGTQPTALRRLPATGSTISMVPGDDGATRAGVARSYVDNGDGTITDLTTGLMWEKKDDANMDGPDGLHDKDNWYAWSGVCAANFDIKCGVDADCAANGPCDTGGMQTIYSWIAQLNSGGGFAGHTDWRIPNRNELESILDAGTSSPAVDPVFNTCGDPGCTVLTCSCTDANYGYWTSTPSFDAYWGVPSTPYAVIFGDGTITTEWDAGSWLHVRAVRGGL